SHRQSSAAESYARLLTMVEARLEWTRNCGSPESLAPMFTLRHHSEHDAARTLPDSTLNAAMLPSAPADDCAAPPASSSVPVSSSFLPTCGLSDVAFAIRRYVVADALAASGAGSAGGAAPEGSAVEGAALVSTNFGASAVPAVPVAPAAPAAPAVPAVPAAAAGGVAGDVDGASFRHPVTVI